MAILARILHIPFSIFSYNSHFYIEELTGVKVPSVLAVGQAAMARLATNMFPLVKALHFEMLNCIEATPLSLLSEDHDRLRYWPSPPLVSVLFKHVQQNQHLICESFAQLDARPPHAFLSPLPAL
eukprot:11349994-Karenia_brevis.AAC.1